MLLICKGVKYAGQLETVLIVCEMPSFQVQSEITKPTHL